MISLFSTYCLPYWIGFCLLFRQIILRNFQDSAIEEGISQEHFEGISFYQTNLSEAPFSFFKNLFWKDSILIHSDLGRQILKHEMVHIEQKHSRDKIFTEMVTACFGGIPFFISSKKKSV
ncbi:hypothetical protein LDL59_07900 [Kaistella anthropi]|nr:hypothetical protein [Kaistella anthropi]